MPCFNPLQAFYSDRSDGKKEISFSKFDWFSKGYKPPNSMLLPCGQCMGCRLERSRQWAVRIMHEASLYDENCFVTLTFNEEHVPKDGSLRVRHMQDFMKRLRTKFKGFNEVVVDGCSTFPIRVFYCGEYGDNLGRPHYHLCLFNFDFTDSVYWKTVNGCDYFTSDSLVSLWPYGFSSIGALTYESAAYVARYCTKKITGRAAKEHYCGKVPEFAKMSNRPGIGRRWIDRFGMTDVYPYDEVVVRGVRCKPPRYYDKVLEEVDPLLFDLNKCLRGDRADLKSDDNSYDRLLVKEQCLEARIKSLVRNMEL